jgi:hypothetical protein
MTEFNALPKEEQEAEDHRTVLAITLLTYNPDKPRKGWYREVLGTTTEMH